MKKRKSIKKISFILGILLVVSLVFFFTGRSFGFFRYVKEGSVTNVITIKGIEVDVLNPENDSLNLENVYPVSDSEGLTYTPFEFTVTNTSTRSLNYSIMVVNDIEKQADCKLQDGTICSELSTDYIKYSYRKNDGTYTEPRNLGENGDIIDNGVIEGNETVKSSIIIWIDENAGNEIMNHYFYGKIIIVGSANTSENYEETLLNGADPVLSDNLVPVKIDNNGTVTKANIKEEWYSYNRKEWANAVVLKDRFDDNTIYDLSGNNNNATIYGATITNEGLSFDGVDDYAKIDLLDWDSTTEFTIEFEAKVLENDEQSILLESSDNSNNNQGSFYINTEEYGDKDLTLAMKYPNDAVKNHKMVNNALKDDFQTYTVIFNSTNNYNDFISIYVNGEKQEVQVPNVSNLTGDVSNKILNDYSFFIGGRNGESWFSKMILKNLKIYTKELTQVEINNNLNNNTTTDKLILMYDLNNYSNYDVIPEEVIESYFVWIPKYSYQLWDLGDYSSLTTIDLTKSHTIPIKFGTTNTNDSVTGECTTPGVAGETGNCKVGDYMTHPAFLAFDTNGIWVGKFETGYDGATSTEEAQTNTNKVDTSKIIIKPNVYSWRNITVGNAFKNSYDYLRETESHMMKNTEWGAVAYLHHSNYGAEGSIRINNTNNVTGSSSLFEPTLGYNSTSIEGNRYEYVQLQKDGSYSVNYFNNLSNKSSTTGNYTGIYDMSGCSWEYVMGYTTGATEIGGGSFITELYNDFFNNSDWEKYYDKYTSISTIGYNNRILGDATGEIGSFYELNDPDNSTRQRSSWYGDYSQFFHSSLPWLRRGGFYANGTGAGIFAFHPNHGTVEAQHSYRIVLAPTK